MGPPLTCPGLAKHVRITFTSSAFPVAPDEDEETNPHLYGRALAHWLVNALREGGREVDDVYAEDYGWIFEVRDPRRDVHVACMNDDGSTDRWMTFLRSNGGLVARWLGKDRSAEALEDIAGEVRRLLTEHPRVSDVSVESP